MRYAVIDVETTGFSPISDRIVEAACVLVEDRAIVRTWTSLVNPGRPIPDYASRVHGITDADVASAPPFDRVQRELHTLCNGATVVAHNAAFDLSFLPLLAPLPRLCTLQLARRRFPNAPNHKNQTLRAYLRIDDYLRNASCQDEIVDALSTLRAHRALADALVTAGVLLRCLDEGQGGHAVRKTA
ncbi:MAG TPA: 3'-5' exonuclease [Candidatus Baltobacteraceae bacterium]|nr:3'-5' exonuclease [Candidatus Baltobacteraceae bacterium]